MKHAQAISALAALAHEQGLAIFRLLAQTPDVGLTASEIARELGVPPEMLSGDLNALGDAGLVTSRHDGGSIHYAVALDRMSTLLTYLASDCCAGRPELCVPSSVIDMFSTIRSSRC